MKSKGLPEAHAIHPNVTPLIDIVMCLIIFFMIVAKIGVTTGAEQMDLVETKLGKRIESFGNTLTVNVRRPIAAHLMDQPRITALVDRDSRELPLIDPAGQRVLLDVLRRFRQEGGTEFTLIIRPEKELEYRFLEPVLIVARDAGVLKIQFNTKQIERVVER